MHESLRTAPVNALQRLLAVGRTAGWICLALVVRAPSGGRQAIEGSGTVLSAAGFRVRPGRIVVRFGKPPATRGLVP